MEQMYVLKLIGAVLLAAGSCGYGISQGRRFLVKSRQLRQLWEYLDFACEEIHYKSATVEEILKALSSVAEAPYQRIFTEMYEKLLSNRQSSLAEICAYGAKLLYDNSMLSKQDLSPLKEILDGGLSLEKRRQEELLALCTERLRQKEKAYYEEYKSKEKVYRSLGICLGCLGIILLF